MNSELQRATSCFHHLPAITVGLRDGCRGPSQLLEGEDEVQATSSSWPLHRDSNKPSRLWSCRGQQPCLWDRGRKPEHLERNHADTQKKAPGHRDSTLDLHDPGLQSCAAHSCCAEVEFQSAVGHIEQTSSPVVRCGLVTFSNQLHVN